MVGDIVEVQKRLGFGPHGRRERFVILAELGEFVAAAPLEPSAPFEGYALAVKLARGKEAIVLAKLACVPSARFGEKVGALTVKDLERAREAIALMFDL